MTTLADQYRQGAKYCHGRAAEAPDPDARAAFEEAARQWEALATYFDRSSYPQIDAAKDRD